MMNNEKEKKFALIYTVVDYSLTVLLPMIIAIVFH
jgi:hypothetical protein